MSVCPLCSFEANHAETCARCGVIFSKLSARRRAPLTVPLQRLDRDGLRATWIGAALAVVVLALPFLRFVFSYLTILVHELGHAVSGWLFGYPSIPAFDFVYGGGLTSHDERKALLVAMIVVAFGWAIYSVRMRPRMRNAALVLFVAYAICAATALHQLLTVLMGHGAELLFAGIALYRAFSGSAIKVAAERPLYGFVGCFILLSDARFALGLLLDAGQRAEYQEAKGGGHWMDFSVAAEQHLGVGLQTVALGFLVACVLTPFLAYQFFRHRERLPLLLAWLGKTAGRSIDEASTAR